MFNGKAQVAVGTPGFFLSIKRYLENVRFLVVDEADEMVTGGDLLKQCYQIKKSGSNKKNYKKPRIMLLSVTYDFFLNSFIKSFVGEKGTYHNIRLKPEEVVPKNILQLYMLCSNSDQKRNFLQHIFENLSCVKKWIVFVEVCAFSIPSPFSLSLFPSPPSPLLPPFLCSSFPFPSPFPFLSPAYCNG